MSWKDISWRNHVNLCIIFTNIYKSVMNWWIPVLEIYVFTAWKVPSIYKKCFAKGIFICMKNLKTRVYIRSWPSTLLRHICFEAFFSHRNTISAYIKNAFLCIIDFVLYHRSIGFSRLSRSTSPAEVYRYVDWLI
jgi:hypothetical protein